MVKLLMEVALFLNSLINHVLILIIFNPLVNFTAEIHSNWARSNVDGLRSPPTALLAGPRAHLTMKGRKRQLLMICV